MGVENTDLNLAGGRSDAPPADTAARQGNSRDEPSLLEDFEALIADGKSYFEAELRFQRTRLGFTGSRIKWAFIYGAAAFGFLHLALIGLVVGLVIALAPLTGAWVAIAIVVGLLLLGALAFVQRLRGKLRDIRSAFDEGKS